MTTRASWKDIEFILFKFKQHSSTIGNYPNIHKLLNSTYSNEFSDAVLDNIFEDATRAKIKPNAIFIIRDKIVEVMKPIATLTIDKTLIKQYIADMKSTSPLASNHSQCRNSKAIETTFLHARKNKQVQVIIILSIEQFYFHPSIPLDAPNSRRSFDHISFKDIGTQPFVLPANPNPVQDSPRTGTNATPGNVDVTALIIGIGTLVAAITAQTASSTQAANKTTTPAPTGIIKLVFKTDHLPLDVRTRYHDNQNADYLMTKLEMVPFGTTDLDTRDTSGTTM